MMQKKIIRLVSSWQFTLILLLLLCTSYVFLTFTERPYEKWINFIFHTPAGLILYIGLIVNLISLNIRIACSRLKRKTVTLESIKNMDTYIELPANAPHLGETITAWAKKKGFHTDTDKNYVIALKGKLSFLPGTLFRTGLIVLMTALLFSAYLRKTEEAVFHEGDKLFGKNIYLTSIKSNLPEEFLQVGEKSIFKLNGVSATLSTSTKTYSITSGFPTKIKGKYYRITNLGFSQPFSVGKSPTENADIDILPPGKTDTLTLPSGDPLTITLQPEKTIKKGLITGKLYNLKTPLYSISFKNKNGNNIEGLSIRPLESIAFGEVDISLGKNSLFVKIQSVYDPALVFIYTGILLTFSGLIFMFSRFFWYEKQMCAVFTDKTVLIGYRKEFYKKWGIQKFHRWKDVFVSGTESSVNKAQTTD
jgi:hypothetical protein